MSTPAAWELLDRRMAPPEEDADEELEMDASDGKKKPDLKTKKCRLRRSPRAVSRANEAGADAGLPCEPS